VLLSACDPNFQAVDGSGGDLGNDGFVVSADTLYQAYGPEVRKADKVRAKISDSIAKASRLRSSTFLDLRRFVFLTPFDLTHEQHVDLRSAGSAAKLLTESWGEAKLLALLSAHPEIKSEFSEILLPDLLVEIRKLGSADEIAAGAAAQAHALEIEQREAGLRVCPEIVVDEEVASGLDVIVGRRSIKWLVENRGLSPFSVIAVTCQWQFIGFGTVPPAETRLETKLPIFVPTGQRSSSMETAILNSEIVRYLRDYGVLVGERDVSTTEVRATLSVECQSSISDRTGNDTKIAIFPGR
jgi:hypothetical protein